LLYMCCIFLLRQQSNHPKIQFIQGQLPSLETLK
jgi:hypothetical protein